MDGRRAGDGRADEKDVDVKTHVLHRSLKVRLKDHNTGHASLSALSSLSPSPTPSPAMPGFVR